MKKTDLFNGIAVVIDDELKKDKGIRNLIAQIEKNKMPCRTYEQLPDSSIVKHFSGISFLLLDWKLYTKDDSRLRSKGVTTPEGIERFNREENIKFLKKLKELCFIPIFIFTNEDKTDVIDALKGEGLYKEDKPNYIFVRSKKELSGRTRLFKEIERWIKKTPSIYVLTAWKKEYQKSLNKLFHDFYNISPNWPNILWKAFADDGVNMSSELGEVIMRNLYSRMTPFAFDEKILNRQRNAPKEEVRSVLEGERFTKSICLHKESVSTGDIFKIKGDYYLNIRPNCDCIPGRDPSGEIEDIDDLDVYLLKGSKLTIKQEKKAYRREYGNFEERDSQSIAFSIMDGKTYDFRFKNLVIKKWSEIKNHRKGRLLPPYITRIQQRYALYFQRQGLPRTPVKAVH
jgi:hypothetical protein